MGLSYPALSVTAANRDQLIVRSAFDHPAIGHHMNHVRDSGGGEAMGDDEGRSPLGELAESAEPIGLGPWVHRARRLVEGDQRDAVLQDAAQAFEQRDRTVVGLGACAVKVVVEFDR